MKPAHDPSKEDLYHVAGDVDHGVTTTADVTSGAVKVPLRYNGKWGDYVCTVDVYVAGEEVAIVMICPRCHHSIKIPSNRKKIEWDPDKGLFVEPSQCTWEMDERDGERIEFGLNLCRFTFAIDGARVRDA